MNLLRAPPALRSRVVHVRVGDPAAPSCRRVSVSPPAEDILQHVRSSVVYRVPAAIVMLSNSGRKTSVADM